MQIELRLETRLFKIQKMLRRKKKKLKLKQLVSYI